MLKIALFVAVNLFCLFYFSNEGLALDTLIRLRERVPLEKLAQSVMDPSSLRYGKFYTPEEIRSISGPDDVEYQALLNDLKTKGYKVVYEDKTRLFITISVPSKIIVLPFSPSAIPSSPTLDLIESITVDENERKFEPRFVPQDQKKTATPVSVPQIRHIYGFDEIYKAGLSGKGQHIAIATYDGFNMGDIQDYYTKLALTMPTVTQVNFNGLAAIDPESAVETEVDVEFAGHIAPGAQIHVFPSTRNNDLGEVQLFTAILDDNRAQVVNYSWGTCEENVSAKHMLDMNKVYARAVAQGVNIFSATGDSGAMGCRNLPTLVAGWPATHPYVVAVGGTSLDTKAAVPHETGWSESGGGISELFQIPSWQFDAGLRFEYKGIPDVSFNADPETGQPGWVQYHKDPKDPYTPMWLLMGGTSIAGPQWAGLMALINEARAGRRPLGFISPTLYAIPDPVKQTVFNDIIDGDNHGFKAGPGWDAVTGWGSPKADKLLEYLRQL